MQLYQEALAPHGVLPAQILLTAGDFDSRARYLNVRNTIRTLFEYGSLPIINENDTVSVAEIKFGDNDTSPRWWRTCCERRCSCCSRMWTASTPPTRAAIQTAKLVATVPTIDAAIAGPRRRARRATLGTGGMTSKLKAAAVGDRRRRSRHHGQRLPRRHPRPHLRRREPSARSSCRTATRCPSGNAGSV